MIHSDPVSIETSDIYGCTMHLNDSYKVMRRFETGIFDAVVTDPPYGVQAAFWDKEAPPQRYLNQCLRVSSGPVVWFGSAAMRSVRAVMKYKPPPDRVIIWHVTFSLAHTAAHGMFYHFHPIWIWRPPKNQAIINQDVIDCPQSGHNSWNHPGTKPVPLMELLVDAFVPERGACLDPFAGSGTTGVACLRKARSFVGIDIEKEYFDIAVDRLTAEANQLKIF